MHDHAPPITLRPIGVVRSPFVRKVEAPRQGVVAAEIEGRVELFPEPGFEHAVEDLSGWDRLWVLTWFDRAEHWRPKVQPPRSKQRRGVFATRSPHRPNPIGLTCVRLLRVEGLHLVVRDLDILDGTPVLDVKPYVAYADAFPDAASGWLPTAVDPGPQWPVHLSPAAREQLEYLATRGLDLATPLRTTLSLGPEPRPYRRIRQTPEGRVIAHRTWRADFHVHDGIVVVDRVRSGLSDADLRRGHDEGELHADFRTRFPA